MAEVFEQERELAHCFHKRQTAFEIAAQTIGDTNRNLGYLLDTAAVIQHSKMAVDMSLNRQVLLERI